VLVGDSRENLVLDIASLLLSLTLSSVRTSLSAFLALLLLLVGETRRVSTSGSESTGRLGERVIAGVGSRTLTSSTVVRRLTVVGRSPSQSRSSRGRLIVRGRTSSDVRSSGTSLLLLSVVGSVGDVLTTTLGLVLDLLLLSLSLLLCVLRLFTLGSESSIGNVGSVVTNFSVRANPLLMREKQRVSKSRGDRERGQGRLTWFEGAVSSTWLSCSSLGRAASAALAAASAATSRPRIPTSFKSFRNSELVKMSLPRVRRCSTACSPSCCISCWEVAVLTFLT